ncbi:MAG TPA: TetR/AcrR family transcriptional regulator [Steroidobacteraceae bacterium]|nr:TetR/AcrR family transcriptional regulator [Steroidobacteraceae bacterium]
MDSEQHSRHKRDAGTPSAQTPARRGPGRQTPNATRQRNLELLDKALDLFLENGFERTTIDAVAASVGMAKRTVYLRYGNKTGLFKASLKRAIESWIVPVERLRAAESDDAEQTLLKVGQILVANIMSPAGLRLMRITNAESGRLPEIGAFAYTQGTAPTTAYLTDLIRRRVRPHGVEVAEPGEAAMAFLYLVVGGPASMTAWGLVLGEKAIDKHTRYAVRLFLHGLLHPQDRSVGTPAGARTCEAPEHAPAAQDAMMADERPRASLLEENRRLKMLLADSMLAVATLKERSSPR